MSLDSSFPTSNNASSGPTPADAAVTELANTNVSGEKLKVAETASANAGDAPSDAATGPSILVLNDLWRYVPAYFQAVEPVQPRSEAGRRLLERRWRQIERRQQQQQRRSAATTHEPGENHRGTLPVDQLLAYITDSAINNSVATSTSVPATSGKGRRKKKPLIQNSDTAVHDNSSSSKNATPDDANKSSGGSERARNEGKKKELKPDVTATDTANDRDFVVVRRGRKQKPPADEKPTRLEIEVPLGRSRRYKATFCDSLDEFSLQDDTVTRSLADRTKVNTSTASAVISECSISDTTSELTESSQTSKFSTQTEVPNDRVKLDSPPVSCECNRPITLRYNDVVKGIRPNWQEKPTVVDEFTETSAKYQHKQPLSTPASNIDNVQTRNSPTTLKENTGHDIIRPMTDVHPINVTATSLNTNSTHHKKHVTRRQVETVSCSTQTSNVEIPQRHSATNNPTAIVDVTGNGIPPRRPNLVKFLDAGNEQTDDTEVQQDVEGLSFGSFDGITARLHDSDKATTKSVNVSRCSDVATSPIKVSPVISSTSSLDTKTATAASHSRRITPLCRTTGSSSLATGAPVGIVPPIMHVDTASGDIVASADNSTREDGCSATSSVDQRSDSDVNNQLRGRQSSTTVCKLDTNKTEVEEKRVQRLRRCVGRESRKFKDRPTTYNEL